MQRYGGVILLGLAVLLALFTSTLLTTGWRNSVRACSRQNLKSCVYPPRMSLWRRPT